MRDRHLTSDTLLTIALLSSLPFAPLTLFATLLRLVPEGPPLDMTSGAGMAVGMAVWLPTFFVSLPTAATWVLAGICLLSTGTALAALLMRKTLRRTICAFAIGYAAFGAPVWSWAGYMPALFASNPGETINVTQPRLFDALAKVRDRLGERRPCAISISKAPVTHHPMAAGWPMSASICMGHKMSW
jgi:hypothetical protein